MLQEMYIHTEVSAHESYERMTTLMNELSLYIMFGLGFILLRSLNQFIFSLLSRIMMARLLHVSHYPKPLQREPYPSLETAAMPHNLKQSLKAFLRERGYQDFAGLAKSYNAYVKSQGLGAHGTPFDVLEEMNEQDIVPNIVTYNILLDLCYKEARTDLAQELWDHCNSQGDVQPDVVTLNIYLKGLQVRHERGETALGPRAVSEVLEKMRTLRIVPNTITYNTAIDICATTKHATEAWNYFAEMKTVGLLPDGYTYSTIVKALKHNAGINGSPSQERMKALLQEMLEYVATHKGQTDEVLFNAVLDTAVYCKDLAAISTTLGWMKEHGVKLSTVTYGILIKAFGHNGMADQAIALFNEMVAHHVPQNAVTYGCLIDACIRAKRFADAHAYVLAMTQQHIPLNIVICTTLLKGYTMQKDLTQVWELYEKIVVGREPEPNIVFYNALLEGLAQCERIDLVEQVYEQLQQEKADSIKCDAITFATLIKAFCKAHKVDAALAIHERARQCGIRFECSLCNILLNSLVLAHRFAKAETFFHEMRTMGTRPSQYTYSIMAKLYKQTERVDQALDLLRNVQKEGGSPGVVFYTCVVQSCVKAKRIEKAIELFEAVKSDLTVKVDDVLYNTIVNGCVYAGRLPQACRFASWATHERVVLATDVYTNLLKNLLTSKTMPLSDKKAQAASLLRFVEHQDIAVDPPLLSRIAKLLYGPLRSPARPTWTASTLPKRYTLAES